MASSQRPRHPCTHLTSCSLPNSAGTGPLLLTPDSQQSAQLPGHPAPPGFQAFLEVRAQTASLYAPPHPHGGDSTADPLPCGHLLPTGFPSKTEAPRRLRLQPVRSRGHLCSPWEECLAAQALPPGTTPDTQLQVQKVLEQKTLGGKFVAAILGNMPRSEGMSNYL